MNSRVVQHRADPDECTFLVSGELTGMLGHTPGERPCRHNTVAYILGKGGRGVVKCGDGIRSAKYELWNNRFLSS